MAPPAGSVLLVGLDGATWDLIHPLILRGDLPNFRRLRQEGAWGDLESDLPMASPRLWATIATGRTPEDHGITGFYKKEADGTETTQTNLDRRTRALWNILSERRRRSTVVGWFYTWPADEIHGEFITDRSDGPMRGGHHPPELETLLAEVAARVSTESVRSDAERFLGPALDRSRVPLPVIREASSIEETLEEYLRIDRLRLEWTVALMRERPSELTAVFFKGVDALSHLVWIHMDPASFDSRLHPSEPVRRRFETALERYYQFLDEAIGELLDHAPPRTDVVIVSDHGFGPEPDPTVKIAYDLNPLLARLGWAVEGVDGRPDPARSAVLDSTPHWQKTHRERFLRVNFENTRLDPEEIVRRLRGVEITGGTPLFGEVEIDPASCASGSESCRIAVRIDDHMQRLWERDADPAIPGSYSSGQEEYPLGELATVRVEFTGSHRKEGVLLMAGPRVRRDLEISGAGVYDVAPTVLRLLGLPPSREMPGRVIEEALRSDLMMPPPSPVATYERDAPIARVDVDRELEEAREEERRLQDRLKTLGYVN